MKDEKGKYHLNEKDEGGRMKDEKGKNYLKTKAEG